MLFDENFSTLFLTRSVMREQTNIMRATIQIIHLLALFTWGGCLVNYPVVTVTQALFELDCGTSNVINDIKTDEFGRFYGGTKCVESCDTNQQATGAFYGYEKGKCLRKFFENVFISNGLTWQMSTNLFPLYKMG
ncbi:hypothetical protein HA402_000588 [Bradysia odoriphaga]|nr:hypothetical protein HA402_000588 [Bradysia odoriphaga]